MFDVNRQATYWPVAANGNNRSNLRCVRRRGWSPRTRSRGGHGSAFALCRSIHGARVRLRMVMCVWLAGVHGPAPEGDSDHHFAVSSEMLECWGSSFASINFTV